MSYFKTMVQLLGLFTLILGGVNENLISIMSGLAVLFIMLSIDIKDNKDKIQDLEKDFKVEKRINFIENKITEFSKNINSINKIISKMRKGQMESQTLFTIVLIIFILLWLRQQGWLF